MANFRKVAITGHRPQDFSAEEEFMVKTWIMDMAVWLGDNRGMTEGISGMALGVDTWWAQAVLEREKFLSAYLPFWQQPDKWSEADKQQWYAIMTKARDVKVFGRSVPYEASNFHFRNEGMIADCDLMLVVLDSGKKSGGTYATFKKLQESGKPWLMYDYKRNEVHGSEDRSWESE